jgi:hypothetical protein
MHIMLKKYGIRFFDTEKLRKNHKICCLKYFESIQEQNQVDIFSPISEKTAYMLVCMIYILVTVS